MGGNAPLILIGGIFAAPGRHYCGMPLYSMGKSTIPTVVQVLALEVASMGRRCIGVVFDMVDGGIDREISEGAWPANADRSQWGTLPTPQGAAEEIIWVLENQSNRVSGATVTLFAGTIP